MITAVSKTGRHYVVLGIPCSEPDGVLTSKRVDLCTLVALLSRMRDASRLQGAQSGEQGSGHAWVLCDPLSTFLDYGSLVAPQRALPGGDAES